VQELENEKSNYRVIVGVRKKLKNQLNRENKKNN
jgi:hypothetical protein